MASLRRKLELALTGYLEANASTFDLTAAKIVSSSTTEEVEVPRLIVIVGSGEADGDLPQVQRFKVTLKLETGASPGGSERASADTTSDKLHNFVMKPLDDNAAWSDTNREGGALLLALNKPASGPDNRTVKPLHIYDFSPSSDDGDLEPEGWVELLSYDVVCQPMDSH